MYSRERASSPTKEQTAAAAAAQAAAAQAAAAKAPSRFSWLTSWWTRPSEPQVLVSDPLVSDQHVLQLQYNINSDNKVNEYHHLVQFHIDAMRDYLNNFFDNPNPIDRETLYRLATFHDGSTTIDIPKKIEEKVNKHWQALKQRMINPNSNDGLNHYLLNVLKEFYEYDKNHELVRVTNPQLTYNYIQRTRYLIGEKVVDGELWADAIKGYNVKHYGRPYIKGGKSKRVTRIKRSRRVKRSTKHRKH
jgi:hypothetical protein